MPIFEYLCQRCNRIYSFLSLSLKPSREPICPRCGASHLTRVPSAFAVGGGRKEAKETTAKDEGLSPALERELDQLVSSMDERDMDDPRAMAKVMRRLAEASGEPVPETLQEMMRRMEEGEDPEALEEELGDRLEEELGEEEEAGLSSEPQRDPGLYSL